MADIVYLHESSNGLFGATLNWILRVLPWLDENKSRPKWDITFACYGAMIPNILEYQVEPEIKHSEPVISKNLIELLHTHEPTFILKHQDFDYLHNLFFKFFKLPKSLVDIVNEKTQEFKGKVLGIHFRGTDKMNYESKHLSHQEFIQIIVDFLQEKIDYKTIFLASDEEDFVQKLQNAIANTVNLVMFKEFKRNNQDDKVGVHVKFSTNATLSNKEQLAKEAMLDSLCLARCNLVLKTASQLSAWSKIWNPQLEVYNVNEFLRPWFPDSAIPLWQERKKKQ